MKLRKVIIVGSALGILIGSFALSNFLSSQKEPPKKKEVKISLKHVKTTPVQYKDISTEVEAFGRVRTSESLDLIAEKAGKMVQGRVRLKEGQKFSKGDLLFQIDDTEAGLNLQAEKSNFLRDLAAILPDLKIDFPQSYVKWEKYFMSIDLDKKLPKLPEYKTEKEKTFLATKNIFSSYYNIKSSEASMKKYRLYAPFGGTISEVTLQSGSFVNPGNKIAKIHRIDQLELKVDVEIEDLEWIEKGKKVKISSQDGKREWNGYITRIGDMVNERTQAIDVYVQINSNKFPVYDGLYLKSVIPGKIVKNAMEIPRNAIFNGNQVFIVKDSLLKSKEILVQRVTAESVIFSGLPEGTDLVIEPLINAYPNMKVAILSDVDTNRIDPETKVKLVKN